MKRIGRKILFTMMLGGLLFATGCQKKIAVQNEYPSMLNVDTSTIDDNYRTYYEIFLYSFCDSDGDGIGDINGLLSKMDYLNDNDPSTDTDLGITGIWLMPIMPSDTYHKYNVSDYYSIDPSYGTMDDFKLLIEECNKRNIKLMIDLVFNHTSNTHPWFQEAIQYLRGLEDGEQPNVNDCKYIEYYNFEQDATSPNYRKVDMTDWYYEAVFTDNMPDLNLDYPEVRKEIEQIASYWIDLGVEGFRLDAAKEYFSGSQSKNIEVLNWFNEYVKSIDPDCYVVAEVWDSFGTIASYYESGIDSVFNYALGNSDGKFATTVNNSGNNAGYKFANNLKKIQDTFYSRNSNYIDATFLSNHDNNRVSAYVSHDEDKIKLLGGMNLMMSGASFIYYGEELGMVGVGRDENKRMPMFWSTTNLEQMTKGPENMEVQAQVFPPEDEQTQQEDSILNYYRRAIRLRNSIPEIARGKLEVMEGLDQDLTAVIKTYEDNSVILIMNISAEEKIVSLPKSQYTYETIVGSLTTGYEQPVLREEMLTLPPYAIVVIK